MRAAACRVGSSARTHATPLSALRSLYEGLGFVRDKRLHKYYLNGNDAFRLKVWFPTERTQQADDVAPSAA